MSPLHDRPQCASPCPAPPGGRIVPPGTFSPEVYLLALACRKPFVTGLAAGAGSELAKTSANARTGSAASGCRCADNIAAGCSETISRPTVTPLGESATCLGLRHLGFRRDDPRVLAGVGPRCAGGAGVPRLGRCRGPCSSTRRSGNRNGQFTGFAVRLAVVRHRLRGPGRGISFGLLFRGGPVARWLRRRAVRDDCLSGRFQG